MKPKTKLQVRIVGLHKKVKKLNSAQFKYAAKHVLDHMLFVNKSGTYNCMDCGHSWKGKRPLESPKWHKDISKEYLECLSCREKLLIEETQKRTCIDSGSYCVFTTCKEFQLIRMFYFRSTSKVKTKKFIYYNEIGQIWISPNGKYEYIGLSVNTYSSNYFGWFDLKHRKAVSNINYIPHTTYPKLEIIDQIYRNGFYDDFLKIKPFEFFHAILTSSIAETLLKDDEIKLFTSYVNNRTHKLQIDKYWSSIKIALRHRYAIENVGDYLDYLGFLEEDCKDLYSPKYICPRNFHEAHQKYVEKLRRQHEQERRIRQAEQREEARLRELKKIKNYNQYIKKFLHLEFEVDTNIVVRPLKTLKEIEKAGNALHHCIYSRTYYEDSESLLMVAYDGDKIIETTQINLRKFEVEQSRGLQNADTVYTEKIIATLNSNMNLIKQALKPKRKKRVTKTKQVA